MKIFQFFLFALLCFVQLHGEERLFELWPEAREKGRFDEIGLKFKIDDQLVLMEGSRWVLLEGIPLQMDRAPKRMGQDWLLPSDLIQRLRKGGYLPKPRKDSSTRWSVRPVVVIDPGHGGKDPGAIGMGGTMEKDVVLDVGHRVEKLLSRQGVTVYLTRRDDVFVDLHRRGEMSNAWRATTFVSLHCNSNGDRRLQGYQLYRQNGDVTIYSRAKFVEQKFPLKHYTPVMVESRQRKFSNHIDLFRWKDEESTELSQTMHRHLEYRRSPVTTQPRMNLCVLRETMAPSVLVEMDFVSNPEVEVKVNLSSWRQKMAEDIVSGILNYLGIEPQS